MYENLISLDLVNAVTPTGFISFTYCENVSYGQIMEARATSLTAVLGLVQVLGGNYQLGKIEVLF